MERGKITLLWKIKEKFLLILRKIVHKRTVMLKNGKYCDMGVLKKGKALASYINRVIYNTIDMVLAFFLAFWSLANC